MYKWWGALDRARKLMLIAITAMAVSQFLNYRAETTVQVDRSVYMPPGQGDTVMFKRELTGTETEPAVTGWSMNSHAGFMLVLLAIVFGLNPDLGVTWKRWMYWPGVAALVFAIWPLDWIGTPGLGVGLGVIAIAIGVWALRVHGQSLKAAAA